MPLFFGEIESRIREGIALHDAGKFDEAIAVYEGVLKDYPRSAWCYYERNQTSFIKATRTNTKVVPDWATTRTEILRSDPMYALSQASNVDEVYDLMLRAEIDGLFKEKTKAVRDHLRYADIAVELGQPGLAAMLYWNIVSNVQPAAYQNRDLIEAMLYCLEQLGEKTMKVNFNGDHAAEFARIDVERVKRKQESLANNPQRRKSK